jgi:ABC-type dipeptide/oligopeptide/nickel transport system permease subunit
MSSQSLPHRKAAANSRFFAEPNRANDSYMRRSLRVFFRQKGNLIALFVITAGLLMTVTPHDWLPYDPTEMNLADRLQPPSWLFDPQSHPLGTDVMGRDLLTRMIFAARWTYVVSGSAVR